MSTKFPHEIDDQYSLYTAKDNVQTILTCDISDSTSLASINVMSTADFPDSGIITVHNKDLTVYEKFYYISKTPTSFTGITRSANRAFSTCCKVYVSLLITEDYHNSLKDAVIEIEKYIFGDSTSEINIKLDIDGSTKYYDFSRSKWISTAKQSYIFSRGQTNLGSQYLRFGDNIVTSTTGPRSIRDLTITAISVQCENNVNASFNIRKNNTETNLYSLSLIGISGDQKNNLNLDLNLGDFIQLYMNVNSSSVSRPIVMIEFAWRF